MSVGNSLGTGTGAARLSILVAPGFKSTVVDATNFGPDFPPPPPPSASAAAPAITAMTTTPATIHTHRRVSLPFGPFGPFAPPATRGAGSAAGAWGATNVGASRRRGGGGV